LCRRPHRSRWQAVFDVGEAKCLTWKGRSPCLAKWSLAEAAHGSRILRVFCIPFLYKLSFGYVPPEISRRCHRDEIEFQGVADFHIIARLRTSWSTPWDDQLSET
jgi:hypothetical protein